MEGKKIDGVRIEYRIKGKIGVTGGAVTNVEYISEEQIADTISELFGNHNIEWIMIDRYHRKNYSRVEP